VTEASERVDVTTQKIENDMKMMDHGMMILFSALMILLLFLVIWGWGVFIYD